MRTPQPCGTPAAYQRHVRAKQDACDPCKAAHTAYSTRKNYEAGRSKPKPPLKPCGSEAAYQRHIRAKEDPCDACRAAAVEADRQRRQAQA